ncbi:uncharacterized protein N7511_006261 [Penicillium nucicola]|uniref:uncharacterized protein n=1 Tax=Penicillium nucicola TaxID=1850975 RepID=UPI0025456D72|nr:uncharacterized protein N7511_006261 [Penicillium nucicola]KAJ5757567.1 hypothetical protein N7511_006261 [Penicillium nucicola]
MESPNYFSRFSTFNTRTTTSATEEFSRLALEMKWKEGSRRYKNERSKFLRSEFSIHFGTDATKLENWQALCVELEIIDPIQSINQCRKALAKVHVNLVDLVDSRRTGKKVKHFASHKALRNYTVGTGRIFPKSAAKEDGFLKALLRQIF